MDALVAYGSDSDDSGSETTIAPVLSTVTKESATSTHTSNAASASTKISSLSSLLPPPKSQTSSGTTAGGKPKSSALPSKVSKYSSLPTLEPDSDSEEEESEFRKKAKLAAAAKSGAGVGALFAMLPAPKNALTASSASGSASASATKAAPGKAASSLMPRTVKKPATTPKKPAVSVADSKDIGDMEEEEESDEEPVSFFPLGAAVTSMSTSSSSTTSALNKAASNSYIPLFFDKKPLTTEEQQAKEQAAMVEVSMTNEQYAYPSNEQYAYPTNEQYSYPTNDQYAYSSDGTYAAYDSGAGYVAEASAGGRGANTIELDDVGLQKLGMRKARDMPINVIDVHAKDQMGHAQQLRQSASANHNQPKPVDLASIQHLKPSAGQKRKHNIMHLAYQAKANEQQLNASWAASRQTKAETQSKYGF
ncbi:hypothetical protein BGZ51_007159 [Haplosporangium sp. Z 767]|nr:hypothetical protein BGZ50_007197 [Haplosporangium sp. Z 11]KAF9179195.1 hypothetical protein BGZ51_007159 [Haplosporangium sp. Z 767]